MASFVVMRKAGDAELVRDAFSWPAFIAPPLWFAATGLWVEALVALALWIGVSALTGLAPAAAYAGLALALVAGAEWSVLHLAAFRRAGWSAAGIVIARDRAEAEFKLALRADKPMAKAALPAPALSPAPRGLFDH